jgi:hypothetical protein
MKRITLIIAAMFAMAQMNAATNDAAVSNETNNAEVATATQAGDDESTYVHPFKNNDDESTKHWTIETNGLYFGMGVKHNWDVINNSFEMGLLNIVAVNYNSLHGQNLSLGLGIHHRSYSIKRPNMLVRDDNHVVALDVYPSENINEIKDRTSNLNMWTWQVPLMFRQKIVKKLEIGVAGILNWNYYARLSNYYEVGDHEMDDQTKKIGERPITVDILGIVHVAKGFGVYCKYSPMSVFKKDKGPDFKSLSVGFYF